MRRTKFLIHIFLFYGLNAYSQIQEVNLYLGNQFLSISQINEWEHIWDLNPIKSALSTELSANYYPFENKRFFIQPGLKYHKVRSQNRSVEFFKEVMGISDVTYGDFRYGFDSQYFVFHISPSYKISVSKSVNLMIGIGLMTHLVKTKQYGFQVHVDPETFASTTSQYQSKYRAYGLSYNLSTSISKRLTNRLMLALKMEYNWISTVIGEESESAIFSILPNRNNITVPIHRNNLNLSGLNMLLGVSYKINKI